MYSLPRFLSRPIFKAFFSFLQPRLLLVSSRLATKLGVVRSVCCRYAKLIGSFFVVLEVDWFFFRCVGSGLVLFSLCWK